jgi:DNA-binding response OmpR family regulator
MKPRILIVADDAAFRATLARWLLSAGYAVELAESVRRAREVTANEAVALAIVAPDGMGSAGAELAREIGEQVEHLILVAVPARDAAPSVEVPVVSAACLSWPCSEQDLLARIRSELAGPPIVAAPEAPQLLRFEGYTLDAAGRSCLDANGQEVTLTRAEFSLLLAFARQPGRVLSRDELTHVAAGRGAEPDDRSVDVLISRLRRKIEPDPKAPRIIVTMPGEGYKFTAKPQVVAADPAIAVSSVAVAAPKEAPGGGASAQGWQTRETARERAPRPTPALRVLAWATVITLVAGLGWALWTERAPPPQATASQAGSVLERRAAVFKRMVAALQDDRFSWRTVERLAIESGVDEAEAHEILAGHPGEVVLGKSHDGKLIARLADR